MLSSFLYHCLSKGVKSAALRKNFHLQTLSLVKERAILCTCNVQGIGGEEMIFSDSSRTSYIGMYRDIILFTIQPA